MIPRVFLTILRFSLSAWLGMALYFNLVVLDLLDTAVTERYTKYNDPMVFLPAYHGLALVLLGAALTGALAGFRNPRIGPVRKWVTFLFVLAAFAVALIDYTFVYRRIAGILKTPNAIPAAQMVDLYQRSRSLKETVLMLSAAATIVALWPARSANGESEHAGSEREPSEQSGQT
jgi:hypothetical protein